MLIKLERAQKWLFQFVSKEIKADSDKSKNGSEVFKVPYVRPKDRLPDLGTNINPCNKKSRNDAATDLRVKSFQQISLMCLNHAEIKIVCHQSDTLTVRQGQVLIYLSISVSSWLQ